eukprot:TRINITY_DN1669_c0_g1_i7.p1 TRINITY_DN1669_c0_g1~~TRINITY_DN1669_c0_g1_i7.p1  ORF type:complete len:599 (-),score=179.19 TRINITY_DN1669_c0_g1_i7:6-1802(-)
MRVEYDFDARSAEELTIRRGQFIDVVTEDASGWYWGVIVDKNSKPIGDGRLGSFPYNYCTSVEIYKTPKRKFNTSRKLTPKILKLQEECGFSTGELGELELKRELEIKEKEEREKREREQKEWEESEKKRREYEEWHAKNSTSSSNNSNNHYGSSVDELSTLVQLRDEELERERERKENEVREKMRQIEIERERLREREEALRKSRDHHGKEMLKNAEVEKLEKLLSFKIGKRPEPQVQVSQRKAKSMLENQEVQQLENLFANRLRKSQDSEIIAQIEPTREKEVEKIKEEPIQDKSKTFTAVKATNSSQSRSTLLGAARQQQIKPKTNSPSNQTQTTQQPISKPNNRASVKYDEMPISANFVNNNNVNSNNNTVTTSRRDNATIVEQNNLKSSPNATANTFIKKSPNQPTQSSSPSNVTTQNKSSPSTTKTGFTTSKPTTVSKPTIKTPESAVKAPSNTKTPSPNMANTNSTFTKPALSNSPSMTSLSSLGKNTAPKTTTFSVSSVRKKIMGNSPNQNASDNNSSNNSSNNSFNSSPRGVSPSTSTSTLSSPVSSPPSTNRETSVVEKPVKVENASFVFKGSSPNLRSSQNKPRTLR